MNVVNIANVEYQIPSDIEELSDDQGNHIAMVLYKNDITEGQKRILILAYLLKIKKTVFSVISPDIIINSLFPLVNFLFEKNHTKALIRKFDHNGVTYHCPASNMNYSSYIEFAMASILMMGINHNTATADNYNEVVAILCRPSSNENIESENFSGDIREKYNSYHVKRRAEEFKNLPDYIKAYVVKFFMAFENYIRTPEGYGVLFQRAVIKKDGVIINSEVEEKEPDMPAWLGFLYDLSGGKFGDFEKTAHTNVHTILIYLCRLRIRKQI